MPRICTFTLPVTLAVACLLTSPAAAQSCPADASAVAAQVSEPQLQTTLYQPLDDMIANAGGLEAAIMQAEQRLSEVQADRSAVSAGNRAALARALDELTIVLNEQLRGLKCRGM